MKVVFAVVVASTKSDQRIEAGLRDLDDVEDQEKIEKSNLTEQTAALQRIKSKLNNVVVQDVELVVKELRRITLLWDELWLGSLNQHHSDIQKRLLGLAEEAKRLNSNTTLSIEQKSKMMADQQGLGRFRLKLEIS